MRSAILSGTKSGETDRTGYSLAGLDAWRKREVVGCGARMDGEEPPGPSSSPLRLYVSDWGDTGGEASSMMVVGGTARVLVLMSVLLLALALGPVRILDGRICSKPWLLATFSMDLKYCAGGHRWSAPPGQARKEEKGVSSP